MTRAPETLPKKLNDSLITARAASGTTGGGRAYMFGIHSATTREKAFAPCALVGNGAARVQTSRRLLGIEPLTTYSTMNWLRVISHAAMILATGARVINAPPPPLITAAPLRRYKVQSVTIGPFSIYGKRMIRDNQQQLRRSAYLTLHLHTCSNHTHYC
ncbi:hypothetical protein JOB18_004502 [Solea senegalensis]|uniref:Uncharacterized protein n=1 Tax=Solea senegalensis TaxID=28829 RepID=A0AAV6T3C6_SOLSE|nr:hypothetical protein JOB18_004502 [Solea senegalensis]